MAFRPTPASQDRHAYVPPQMKQALAQHMQKSVPAHLKNYQQDGRAFIPTHVEKAIVDHMQKSVPAHMKEYVGAYVQQNVTFPATMPQGKPNVATVTPHMPRSVTAARPPIPQIPRQPSAMPAFASQGQSTADLLKATQPVTQFSPAAPQPSPPPATPPSGSPDMYPQTPTVAPHPYDFIMNPDQPAPPKKPLLPGTGGKGMSSIALRVCLVAGGLLVLLVIFSIARNLLSGSGNQPLYMAVAQDQQALIHLVASTTAEQNTGLSITNANFAATASLSLVTAKSDLIAYMSQVGIKKIDPKVLNLKVSAQTDKQLADAAIASTYNDTFREIMKTKLTTYKQDLQQAYNKTAGPNGKKLFTSQFDQAELLLKQLETPAS